MNLIEKLGIVVGDQVQYTGGTDMTIYTVKEAYPDFVVASGGVFDFLTMLGCEIQKAESLQADHCSDIRNHLSPNTVVVDHE